MKCFFNDCKNEVNARRGSSEHHDQKERKPADVTHVLNMQRKREIA